MDNLRQLMAAYFHQDWWDEYGGAWEAAVDDFVRREHSRVAPARAEITTLLTSTGSDDELADVLDALGNFRDPGDAPDAHRRWLNALRDRLSETSESHAS